MESDNQVSDGGNKISAFPIVAIGASAGGIDALEELLHYLPAQTGMVYLYIQHSGTDTADHLVSALSKTAKMHVVIAKEGEMITPDHLYVLPPGRAMQVEDYNNDLEGVFLETDLLEEEKNGSNSIKRSANGI